MKRQTDKECTDKMELKTKNQDISPYTGWAYHDWQQVAKDILQNTYPHFSTGCAHVEISSSRPSLYGP